MLKDGFPFDYLENTCISEILPRWKARQDISVIKNASHWLSSTYFEIKTEAKKPIKAGDKQIKPNEHTIKQREKDLINKHFYPEKFAARTPDQIEADIWAEAMRMRDIFREKRKKTHDRLKNS